MTALPDTPKSTDIYCPAVKTITSRSECLEIRCPFHSFWSGISVDKAGGGCQYHAIQAMGKGGDE